MSEISDLTQRIVEFRDERDWEQFHSPKNLAAAVSVEAAELQELFLWQNGRADESRESDDVAEEIADVLIYALLFCHQTGIDPARAVLTKLELNRERYPVDQARGRSDKYTELEAPE